MRFLRGAFGHDPLPAFYRNVAQHHPRDAIAAVAKAEVGLLYLNTLAALPTRDRDLRATLRGTRVQSDDLRRREKIDRRCLLTGVAANAQLCPAALAGPPIGSAEKILAH